MTNPALGAPPIAETTLGKSAHRIGGRLACHNQVVSARLARYMARGSISRIPIPIAAEKTETSTVDMGKSLGADLQSHTVAPPMTITEPHTANESTTPYRPSTVPVTTR